MVMVVRPESIRGEFRAILLGRYVHRADWRRSVSLMKWYGAEVGWMSLRIEAYRSE